MNKLFRSIVAAVVVSALPVTTYAASLKCKGKIVKRGMTEATLLKHCGSPTSVEGNDWLYERPGSIPMVVTINRGVIAFIRNLEESDAGFGNHPYGDRP